MNQAAQANAAQAESRYKALATVAAQATANGDESSAVAAAMAIAMTQDKVIAPQYVESSALKWASIIVPSVANLGGLAIQADIAKNASNNARDVQIGQLQANQAIQLGQQGMVTQLDANSTTALTSANSSTGAAAEAISVLGLAGFGAINRAGDQTVDLGKAGLDTIENTNANNNALTDSISGTNAGIINNQIQTPLTNTQNVVCTPGPDGGITCGVFSAD